ncbi:MAG: ankyrin repeat domain-containing protein [Rickettsiales bacterium]|jgi:ankyrin repeat protein|nr:ankyrin repeat domain-containing protein [Rickettsiales bacterium]
MTEETEKYSLRIGAQEIRLSLEELGDPNYMSDLLSDIIEEEKEWVRNCQLDKITQLEVIEKLASLKVRLDIHNQNGHTSLYIAIRKCNIEVVELLIKCGANVNDNYERNRTPLHIAIGRKQLEIAKLLIKNGANVNAKTKINGKDGLIPMHFAVFADTPEFIELLSNNGAMINERESTEGYTPLLLAALYSNQSIIQALIDKGQNIEDVDNNGHTALFLAIRQCTKTEDDSRIEVIKYLINELKADINRLLA